MKGYMRIHGALVKTEPLRIETARDHRCGTCAYVRPSGTTGLVNCSCPLPYFLAVAPSVNLNPNDGRDCPAWK